MIRCLPVVLLTTLLCAVLSTLSPHPLAAADEADDPIRGITQELASANAIFDFMAEARWKRCVSETSPGPRAESTPADEKVRGVRLGSLSFDELSALLHSTYADVWARRQDWNDRAAGSFYDLLGELPESYRAKLDPPDDPFARARPSLRDAVTHTWALALADIVYWTEDATAEVADLHLEDILFDTQTATPVSGDLQLDRHPLLILDAILQDLEAWHQEHGRIEAAFEAYRTRIEYLWYHFRFPWQQEMLINALSDRLDQLHSSLPWWSYGRYQLADLVRQFNTAVTPSRARELDGSDILGIARARELAREGAKRHPDSPGGRLCTQLVALILDPEDYLSTAHPEDVFVPLPPRRNDYLFCNDRATAGIASWEPMSWEPITGQFTGLLAP